MRVRSKDWPLGHGPCIPTGPCSAPPEKGRGGKRGVHFPPSAPIGSHLTEVRMSVLCFKLLRLLRNKPMRHTSKSADGKMTVPRWFGDGYWCGQGPKHKRPRAGVEYCEAQLRLDLNLHQGLPPAFPTETAHSPWLIPPLVFPCCTPRVGAQPLSSMEVLAPHASKTRLHSCQGPQPSPTPRLGVSSADLGNLHILSHDFISHFQQAFPAVDPYSWLPNHLSTP